VHVQNERGREEVFPIVELSRERARLVAEDENEEEEGRDDAVPFRKGGGRLSAVAATSPLPSFDYKPHADDDESVFLLLRLGPHASPPRVLHFEFSPEERDGKPQNEELNNYEEERTE